MADELITRADAMAQGLKYFFTGKPCRRGHVIKRHVGSGCVECTKINLRRYRKERPEHYIELDRKYKNENREKLRERGRLSYATNPEKHRANSRKHYWSNTESCREYSKERHKRKQSDSAEYRNEAVARAARWALKNPERAKVLRRNGKARRKAILGTHTHADIQEILKMQRGKCAYCRKRLTKYQVDHIIAVAKGGTNDRKNVQVACGKCNRAKSAKDPIDFARSLGKLL